MEFVPIYSAFSPETFHEIANEIDQLSLPLEVVNLITVYAAATQILAYLVALPNQFKYLPQTCHMYSKTHNYVNTTSLHLDCESGSPESGFLIVSKNGKQWQLRFVRMWTGKDNSLHYHE